MMDARTPPANHPVAETSIAHPVVERRTVLHVITDTDRRGAQVFAHDLVERLNESARDHTLLALTRGTNPTGLSVETFGPRRLHPVSLLRLRSAMAQADVVVAHGSSTLMACAAAGLTTRTPLVYRQVSQQLFWARSLLRRARVKQYLRRATKVVALWSGAADTLEGSFGVPAHRIVIIPNGVPSQRFVVPGEGDRGSARRAFGLDPTAPVFLCLGALVREKGVDLAIAAVARDPSWQLLIAGGGPEEHALRDLARRTAPERIRFVGPVERSADVLAAADVLVLPSRGGDSMPAVLIEAAFCGVPSVATPVEGIVEIVIPNRTGRLVSEASPSALAAEMAAAYEDRHRLGAGARSHCLGKFDIGVIAEQWRHAIGGLFDGG